MTVRDPVLDAAAEELRQSLDAYQVRVLAAQYAGGKPVNSEARARLLAACRAMIEQLEERG